MCALQTTTCVFHNCTVYVLHEVRVMVFGEKQLRFTPIEYNIMLHLLGGQPISDKVLVTDLFHSELDMWTREALEKHIGNLRKKLKKSHVQFRILRVAMYGYVLFADESKTG